MSLRRLGFAPWLVSLALAGCGGSDEQPIVTPDATSELDGSADTTIVEDSPGDTSLVDSAINDSSPIDSGVDAATDTATADSAGDTSVDAPVDTLVADTFVADTTASDTSVADTLVADTAAADTTVVDTSVVDTAVVDTTVVDTTVADTSVADTAVADTAPADTGSDTGGGACSGEGFAATGANFPLPTAYTGAWYNALSGSTSCGSSYSRPAYQVFDIDADGLPDLVVMDSCTTGSNVGYTRWIVHKNTGSGFAATGVDWALPTAYSGAWYNALSGSTSCGSSYSRPAYQVVDIDGDRLPDLVVMDSCTTGSNVGYTRWIVHKNTGSGFAATGVDWALPTAYTGAWFNELSGSTSCGSSYSRPAYQVFDIDADGKQDLVVMDSCASGSDVGYSRWLVHKNTGSAFAATGVDWALPTAYAGAWFNELAGSTSCGSSYSRPAYQVFDLDADGKQDLVVMDSCTSGSNVGYTRWLLHKNTGSAFAATGVDWALPTAYTGAWYNALSGSTSCGSSYSRPAYHVFDIDTDGKMDLVVMDSCATGSTVGYTHWLVHRNDGSRFAASATSWCLPTAYTGAWYNDLSGSTSCGSSYSRPAFQVVDINNNGRLDLVVMDSCASGSDVGYARWLVH